MARKRRNEDEEDEEPKKKKKSMKPRSEEVDIEEPEEDEVPPLETSRNQAYSGLAIITFVALVATAVIFNMDSDELSANSVQTASIMAPGLGSGAKGGGPPAAPIPPTPPATPPAGK